MWSAVPASSTTPGSGRSPSLAMRTAQGVYCCSQSAMPAANCWSMCCTISTGAIMSAGRPVSSFASAAGPPEEAPIATSGAPDCLRVERAVGRFVPMSPISLPMVSILRSSVSAALRSSPRPSSGVSTASSAPWPIASKTRQLCAPMEAVTTRIAQGLCAMICRVASTPSMPGVITSISTRSGVSFFALATASAPSIAVHAIFRPGRKAIDRRSASIAIAESLTMPIRISGAPREGLGSCRFLCERAADEIMHCLQQRFVVEAALGEIEIRAGLKAAPAVLFAVLVADDHDRRVRQARLLLDQGDQRDAVHARHVHIGDHQVEMADAHRVPAVGTVHGDFDFEAAALDQLALQLAHGQRVLHHQHALAPRPAAPADFGADLFEMTGGDQLVDRAQQVEGIQDQHRRAVVEQRPGAHVLDLAQARVERLHHQLAHTQEPVHHQAVAAVVVA